MTDVCSSLPRGVMVDFITNTSRPHPSIRDMSIYTDKITDTIQIGNEYGIKERNAFLLKFHFRLMS